MGVQCRPFGTSTSTNHSAKASKAEPTKKSPISSRQSSRSGRALPRTAVMPLVPRAPWPKGIPGPSGRKSKSVSPSTSEKAISTPHTTKDVGAQPALPHIQVLKRSSSCGALLPAKLGRPHKDMWGANAPTTSPINHLDKNIPSDLTIDSLISPETTIFIPVALKTIPFYEMWNYRERAHFQVPLHAPVRPRTVSVDHVLGSKPKVWSQQDIKCISVVVNPTRRMGISDFF